MTSAEIRNEIYAYIYDNILNKKVENKQWHRCKKDMSHLLKKFATAENPTIINTVPKIKKLSPKEQQEIDLKRGIWRPTEYYNQTIK